MRSSISAPGFRISCLLALLVGTLLWARGQKASKEEVSPGVGLALEGRSVERGRLLISKDGRTVALAGHRHSVQVWRDGTLRRVLPGKEVFLVGDDQVLARSDRSFSKLGIGIWSLEGSEPGRRLAAELAVSHLTVSADGRHVFVGTSEGRVEKLEVHSGETLWQLPEDPSRQWPRGLEVLPEGRVAIFGRNELQVWDPDTGRPHCASAIDWEYYDWEGNGSGTALLFNKLTREFAVWDLDGCQELLRIDGYSGKSLAAISSDGRYMAMADWGGSQVRLWDLASRLTLAVPELEIEKINALHFHPVTRSVLIVGGESDLLAYSLERGTHRSIDVFGGSRFRWVALSALGGRAVGTDGLGKVGVLDLRSGHVVFEAQEPFREILGLAWSDDGEVLFAETRFNGMFTFDLSRGQVMEYRSSGNGQPPLGKFAVGGGGEWLAAGHSEGYVQLFRTGEDSPYAELRSARDPSSVEPSRERSFTVDPSGQRIATASARGPVSIWDGSSGHRIFTLDNPTKALGTLRFSPDGRYLLGYGQDARLVVWRVDRRLLVEVLEPMHSWPSLSVPDDGGLGLNLRERPLWKRWNQRAQPEFLLPLLPLRQAGEGSQKEIFGLDSYHRLAAFDRDLQVVWSAEGVRGSGLSFAVSPEGDRVALGTYEPAIEVFDRRTRELLEWIPGHRAGVQALAWSPDGRFLASGDVDGVIHLRDANDYRLLARIFLSCHRGWVVAEPGGRWDADPSRCARKVLGTHTEGGIVPLQFASGDHAPGFWRQLSLTSTSR